MELAYSGVKSDSLLFTHVKTSDPFEADADTEYREKRDNERQRVIDELKRRNFEGQYDV